MPEVAIVTNAALWWIAFFFAYLISTYVMRFLIELRYGRRVADDILNVVKLPPLVVIGAFGIANSLEVLSWFQGQVVKQQVGFALQLTTGLIGLVMFGLAMRVVVAYGRPWARRRKPGAEIIFPPLARFGTPILAFIVFWYIAQQLGALYLGIDLTVVVISAGLIGLLLGPLQDPLSNFFSGLGLMMYAPFKDGDLIVLSDGKICEVKQTGLVTTELYHVEEHSTIYVPNKDLAGSAIVNITKPTVDLKVSIDVGLSYSSDLATMITEIRNLALAHPNVLASDLEQKRDAMKAANKDKQPADRYQQALDRLKDEMELNAQIKSLNDTLKHIERLTQQHRKPSWLRILDRGLDKPVRKDITDVPVHIAKVVECMNDWNRIQDPWAEDQEKDEEQNRWADKNDKLLKTTKEWEALSDKPSRSKADRMAEHLRIWLRDEYKQITKPWKDPSVRFLDFGPSSVDLRVSFYVDNIRLEHSDRKQRVITEIAGDIHRQFKDAIPFPQMDILLKNNWVKEMLGERKDQLKPSEANQGAQT